MGEERNLNERVELETDRLLLWRFHFGDVDDVLAYASEPEYGWYLTLPQPYARDDAAKFVAPQILDDWSTRPTFAMVFEGHVVGGVGLRVDGRGRGPSLATRWRNSIGARDLPSRRRRQ